MVALVGTRMPIFAEAVLLPPPPPWDGDDGTNDFGLTASDGAVGALGSVVVVLNALESTEAGCVGVVVVGTWAFEVAVVVGAVAMGVGLLVVIVVEIEADG